MTEFSIKDVSVFSNTTGMVQAMEIGAYNYNESVGGYSHRIPSNKVDAYNLFFEKHRMWADKFINTSFYEGYPIYKYLFPKPIYINPLTPSELIYLLSN